MTLCHTSSRKIFVKCIHLIKESCWFVILIVDCGTESSPRSGCVTLLQLHAMCGTVTEVVVSYCLRLRQQLIIVRTSSLSRSFLQSVVHCGPAELV